MHTWQCEKTTSGQRAGEAAGSGAAADRVVSRRQRASASATSVASCPARGSTSNAPSGCPRSASARADSAAGYQISVGSARPRSSSVSVTRTFPTGCGPRSK